MSEWLRAIGLMAGWAVIGMALFFMAWSITSGFQESVWRDVVGVAMATVFYRLVPGE